ncbi:MAG TPA: TetR/AcrR family transcriptional regulator [Thermomicrobiales bacterium]|jgi:AcrR family transcriptional regulator|nr:TetR/AcrR family transcriptional regulator [Thermomicrobiales bacterium]
MAGDSTTTGRRERNRIQRQRAIQIAGLRLFAERGYDQTSLADIAEAADVAPRTVSLYYPAKLDIALSHVDETVAGLVPTLSERPPGEPVMATLDRWLHGVAGHADPEIEQLTQLTFARNPDIRGLAAARVHDVLVQAIGLLTRDITGPMRPFATEVVASAGSAIVAHLLATHHHEDADAALLIVARFLGAGITELEAMSKEQAGE